VGRLTEHLQHRIALEGPLSVADYMEECLSHPRFGYYRTRDPLGPGGDFVTAPEISQMFGELIGLWLAVTWQSAGSPSPIIVAELGPGRGTLMVDALRAAAKVPEFIAAARVHLVETSPVLRTTQKTALAALDLSHAPQWHEEPGTLPAGPLLIIANEFFDALPIHQFERTTQGWHERRVAIGNDGKFTFSLGPVEPLPPSLPQALSEALPGAIAEICPTGINLMAILARRIADDGIAGLIIDYGPLKSTHGDTLQAVRGHRYANALTDPGEADVTAHVDFAALARAAQAAGAKVHGPIFQGTFLKSLGITARAKVLANSGGGQHIEAIQAAVNRLAGEDGMGTLFKAIVVTCQRARSEVAKKIVAGGFADGFGEPHNQSHD